MFPLILNTKICGTMNKYFFNFENAPCCYWSDVLKASYLQRQIIVHSILYYELSESVIQDFQFDSICKQLLMFQKKLGNDYEKTDYYKYFYDFKGETGYYLYDRLNKYDKNYLTKIAKFVLRNYKRGGIS